MAQILKGAPVAEAIAGELRTRVRKLNEQGITPTLAIVRLGNDPDDIYYENSAAKFCARVGAQVKHITYPADCAEDRLVRRIRRISNDESIHGCLILCPLPEHIDKFRVFDALCPEKDIDGLTGPSLGSVFAGRGVGFPPCTAQACMEILEHYGVELSGKNAVVIGRSLVVGRPVSMMLQQKNATVTMCHSRTENLPEICRRADILVSAAGQPGLIGADCVREGQVIIDVGLSEKDGELCGDACFDEIEPIAAAITPVRGGVASLTTATLVKHLVTAAETM